MYYANLPVSRHPELLLRPLVTADAAAWLANLREPGAVTLTSWVLPTVESLATRIEECASGLPSAQARFAIVERATGELAGTIGFHSVLPENGTAEIAYELAPRFWGRGYASAMVADLLRWVFAEYRPARIQGAVYEGNPASMRVLEKNGFVREGLLRNFRKVGGQPAAFWMYACIVPPAA